MTPGSYENPLDPGNREDPYAPGSGKEENRTLGTDLNVILRYATAAMGVIVIVVGLGLAVSVFGVIRGIIESPDDFVAALDGWNSYDEVESPGPTTSSSGGPSPAVPEQTTPLQSSIAATETPQPITGFRQANTSEEPAAPEAPDPAVSRNPSKETAFDKIMQLLHEFGVGRIAGATFMLVFSLILAYIPIMLIKIGIQLLAATAKVKVPAVE